MSARKGTRRLGPVWFTPGCARTRRSRRRDQGVGTAGQGWPHTSASSARGDSASDDGRERRRCLAAEDRRGRRHRRFVLADRRRPSPRDPHRRCPSASQHGEGILGRHDFPRCSTWRSPPSAGCGRPTSPPSLPGRRASESGPTRRPRPSPRSRGSGPSSACSTSSSAVASTHRAVEEAAGGLGKVLLRIWSSAKGAAAAARAGW